MVSVLCILCDIWEWYIQYRLIAKLSATCGQAALREKLLTGDDLGALEVFVRMEIAWGQCKPEADEE